MTVTDAMTLNGAFTLTGIMTVAGAVVKHFVHFLHTVLRDKFIQRHPTATNSDHESLSSDFGLHRLCTKYVPSDRNPFNWQVDPEPIDSLSQKLICRISLDWLVWNEVEVLLIS
jgi:hypothetical protein